MASILSACGSPGGAPVVNKSISTAKSNKNVPSGSTIVRKGDTLYAIAWKVGLDFQKLAEWNKIRSPYTIYTGQRLRLTSPPVSRKVFKQHRHQEPAKTQPNAQKHKTAASKSSTASKNAAKPTNQQSNLGATRVLRWAWPTDGRIVQGYSGRDPTRKGVKISGRPGQPVRAAEAGKVVYSGSGLIGYGNLVIIKHSRDYLSAYGYNKKLLIAEGDDVSKGGLIAEMGLALDGKPVLHFEIRRKGKPVNPKALLPKQRK
ncbi:Murein hydrolase activator NlpD [hydrothermal vent metagenome]|uniref:Murein hydrolase activator NlpD n=1 Tax=hydrothermal vent metagenome TaxID=652676 RepID=A0A3B1B784_9ZZZZ